MNGRTLAFHSRNQTSERYHRKVLLRSFYLKVLLSTAFILVVTLKYVIYRLNSSNHLVQYNRQYHWKVLLSSFLWNGYNIGFHPLVVLTFEAQKLEPPCTVHLTLPGNSSLAVAVILMDHTKRLPRSKEVRETPIILERKNKL